MFKKFFIISLLFTSSAWAQGIYSCVDAKGRTITADRPIAECLDRTQKELSRTGTVKRTIGPTLTAKERAAQEEQEKTQAEILARQAEEKRRNRALLLRYPNQAVHDKERGEALTQVDEVIKVANQRVEELNRQFKEAGSQRRRDELQNNINIQQRFIEGQEAEKSRISARFDEELTKLNYLWAVQRQAPKVD